MANLNTLKTVDFSFLDQPEFTKKYSFGNKGHHVQFYIAGIRCSKCIRKLESLPHSLPGLLDLRVEMGKNLAHVEFNPAILNMSTLAEKISELGFQPIPLNTTSEEAAVVQREDQNEWVRLAVAGACAGNIMTFSFATYLGDTGSFFALFSWLSFALYLPVVTFVAWPFYLGAWNSLRQKQLSIDLPMAVASLSGFIFSTVELLRGKSDIYFDSLSGFLFLILLSRWGQKRLQRKFLRQEEIVESFHLGKVRISDNRGWHWATIESLKPNDKILILKDETLPADAELVSPQIQFGMAWLSGEVRPKTFLQGAVVPAGAKLVSENAWLIVKNTLQDSHFGKILQEVQKFGLNQNRIVSLADRWAQWLLAIVFAIALVFLFLYWPVSPEEAIRRSLALIILACPCALAFGTPLALASGLRKAKRLGLIIRNANVFEKARRIDTIFFDKTGTLTDTDLSLIENPIDTPHIYKKIILSLENKSSHPIAFSFRKAFQIAEPLLEVENWRELPGVGVSGYIYGRHYEIRRSEKQNSKLGCTLLEESQPLYSFTFEAAIKPDGLKTLQELRSRGYKLFLVSGDNRETAENLGFKLGFDKVNIVSEASPAQKQQLIASHPQSMMVGDGINDSLALMKAQVSVATSGSVETALRSSDVYLTDASLKGVLDLIDVSRSSLHLIRQNLIISAAYNLIAGTLALMGFINPFVAAILMPISSGFILISTWMGNRK